MSSYFLAALDDGEAVLRFPYDERMRMLLRAIPGRRWDPVDRAWRIPLDPECAHTLATLLTGLAQTHSPSVSRSLARAIRRGCAERRRRECVLDLARPDENWWLSFIADENAYAETGEARARAECAYAGTGEARARAECAADRPGAMADPGGGATEAVQALLEHPESYRLPAIGRALIPLDELAERIVGGLRATMPERVRCSEDAEHALTEIAQRGRELRQVGGPVSPVEAREAREARQGRQLERPARPRPWHGTIEAGGDPDEPVFVLLGENERLPPELRELAAGTPGGAAVPLTLASWELIEGRLQGWISRAAGRCVAALREGRPAPPSVLEVSRVHEEPAFVLAPGHDAAQCERFATLVGALPGTRSGVLAPGRRTAGLGADEHARLPAIRADPFCVPQLDAFLSEHGAWIEPEALVLLQEVREQHAHAQGLVELSSATDAELYVTGLGGELKPFQRAGVSYLLARRRAFLADEQGLGKTIEALATLQADGAWPAVVVCPASLKLNWLREIERWLPGRSARMLVGTGPSSPLESRLQTADVTVVNYDIVAARLDELCALEPRALVVDESHYCKNAIAKRTQAVHQLAGAVSDDGLVLALTGTPVMNRPPELISQLRIIGRIGDFGSGAEFGRRFKGPDAHMRLHWHLRARCYVRRLKAEVLPQLPPKTRSVVPIELTNEHEYRLAERDVIAWLRTQPLDLHQLDAKVAAALRAERLVRLNALKLIAARGKLHAALAWIHDFCSSGEPLVVFAKHREIQRAVLERFPHALHILGTDSHAARDASLRAFQESDSGTDQVSPTPGDTRWTSEDVRPVAAGRENRLIVCSLEVAGQGLTLTRASNVAFLELDWTPAKHDQAEDRCHRIGQKDAVNATYLLAAGTIDETIATLLERKRAVIGAVTDGRPEEDEGVVDALVRELAGEPYRALRAVA